MLFIIGLVAFGLWWGYKRISNIPSEAKKSVETISQKSENNSPPPLAKSIQDSLALSPAQDKPKLVSRVVSFKHRNPLTPEFLTALQAFEVTIAYDSASRSALVRGEIENVLDVSELLVKSDLMPAFCSARAWVVFVSDTDASGYDFTAALTALSSDVPITGILDGSGLILNITHDRLSAVINVLASDSRVKLIQQPHVRLMDLIPARVESLEEVPIRSTTVSNGLATSSIEYKRVGLTMEINPHFLGRDRVRMAVKQTGGLVGRNVEIDGALVPVLQTQNVESTIELTIGQSLVLGGVKSSRTRNVKGWLKNTTEIETGTLYVVMSLYDDTPKAVPSSPDWFEELDGMVLPGKGVLPIPTK